MRIRPYIPEADVYQYVAILNQSDPEPITVEERREQEKRIPATTIRRRLAAVDEADRMIGYGGTARAVQMPPGRFNLVVMVDQAHQRRGAGSALFEAVLALAREEGADSLESWVSDRDPAALAFAERRGFRIHRHLFGSTLRLSDYEETPFLPALQTAEQAGFRFFTLEEAGVTPVNLHRLYDVEMATTRDIPGMDLAPRPFADWQRMTEAPWFAPDAQIIVADGDRWVGMAGLAIHQEHGYGYHGMTGVLREYRGRGLATALKLLAIRVARRHGLPEVRTHNDAENGPMLAINRKLGYLPDPGEYRLLRDLL